MNRPYYIHTPRNYYGESLVLPYNNVPYEIRSVFTGQKSYGYSKDESEIASKANQMNNDHETHLAYAMYI